MNLLFRGRCERDSGRHLSRTRRLFIVSARPLHNWSHYELARDHEGLHWLGWDLGTVAPEEHDTLERGQPVLWKEWSVLPMAHWLPLTAIDPSVNLIAGELSFWVEGSQVNVGGHMRKQYRGRGLGTEFLTEAMRLAHRHFGLARVVAGHEDENVASRRWLSKCGFTPTDGPATYTLDNGRQARTLWWEHVDRGAKRRCRWLNAQDRSLTSASMLLPSGSPMKAQ